MTASPSCDGYYVVYNRVKNYAQESFLVSLCSDLPNHSIPAIRSALLHTYVLGHLLYIS